jgi:hypothetical protein
VAREASDGCPRRTACQQRRQAVGVVEVRVRKRDRFDWLADVLDQLERRVALARVLMLAQRGGLPVATEQERTLSRSVVDA